MGALRLSPVRFALDETWLRQLMAVVLAPTPISGQGAFLPVIKAWTVRKRHLVTAALTNGENGAYSHRPRSLY